jgi:hypothetical protein
VGNGQIPNLLLNDWAGGGRGGNNAPIWTISLHNWLIKAIGMTSGIFMIMTSKNLESLDYICF